MIDAHFYIEKFKKLDASQRSLIFLGVLLLIVILDVLVLLYPQMSALKKLNTHIGNQSQQLLHIKANIERKKQWKEEIAKLKEQIAQARLQVTSKEEMPFVLETISHLAEKNAVQVDQVSPQTPNMIFLVEERMRRYYILPIIFKGRTSYHSFGRFLNELENHDHYFKIANFSLKPMVEARLLNATVTVHIIIYEEIK